MHQPEPTPRAAKTTEVRNFGRDFDFVRSSANVVGTLEASSLGLPQSLFTDPDHVPVYSRRPQGAADYAFIQRIPVVAVGYRGIAWQRRATASIRRDFCVSLMWFPRLSSQSSLTVILLYSYT